MTIAAYFIGVVIALFWRMIASILISLVSPFPIDYSDEFMAIIFLFIFGYALSFIINILAAKIAVKCMLKIPAFTNNMRIQYFNTAVIVVFLMHFIMVPAFLNYITYSSEQFSRTTGWFNVAVYCYFLYREGHNAIVLIKEIETGQNVAIDNMQKEMNVSSKIESGIGKLVEEAPETVSGVNYCRKCGAKLIQGSIYCQKCGCKVKSDS